MLKSQSKKPTATAVKRTTAPTTLGPNTTSTRTIKTRPHHITTKPPSPTLKPIKSPHPNTTTTTTLLPSTRTRSSPFKQSARTFAATQHPNQHHGDNFRLDADEQQNAGSLHQTLNPLTNQGGTTQLTQDKGAVDQDGLPSRRLSSKYTYIEDRDLGDIGQVDKGTDQIKDWVAYKELSTLVTAGGRANVYHWLSNRDNRLKVDLNVRDPFGSTLLAQATRRHYYAVTLTLLPFCDTNYETLQGPPIFHSLALADLLITRALLDFGADPNARNPQNQTPLMMAACVDNPSFIQYLIFKGANLNDTDSRGRTALMYAAKKCSPQIAKYLHLCGADTSIQDAQGLTATDYARARGDRDGDYLGQLLDRPPPTQRILPDKNIIEADLETYRTTKLYPAPLDLAKVKHEYHTMAKTYGYQNMAIHPNGKVELKSPEMGSPKNKFPQSQSLFLEEGDELPAINANPYQSSSQSSYSSQQDDYKRTPPSSNQRRTVFEDLLDRGDFTQRPIEHVDQRYLEWYSRCRTIHLEDDVFRAGNSPGANAAKAMKDQKQ